MIFGQELCDLLVLDEASQNELLARSPDGGLLALKAGRPVGSSSATTGEMPPIVKHDVVTRKTRRTFRQYQVYASLFDTLRLAEPAHDPLRRVVPAPLRRWPSSCAPGGLPARRYRLSSYIDGIAGAYDDEG